MNPADTARSFFDRLAAHDLEGALALCAPDAPLRVVPLARVGRMALEGRDLLTALLRAFPDLELRVRRLFVTTDTTAVAEVTMEGTQADMFLGIVNQEKHLDLDQAWLLHVTDGRIDQVSAYWCQNQLYRRLAVRRLDRITVTA